MGELFGKNKPYLSRYMGRIPPVGSVQRTLGKSFSDKDASLFNQRAFDTLEEIELYPNNWDGDGAPAFSRIVLQTVSVILKKVTNFKVEILDVTPYSDRQIGIELVNGDKILHLMLHDEELIFHKYLHYPEKADSVREYEKGSVQINEVLNHLLWLHPELMLSKEAA